GESGALYDVWGTDENNVYAVGGVRINDTTYGVIHWDGTQWKPELKVGGKYAIYGFDRDDIWITGTSIYHYNGSNWIRVSDQDPILNEYITYTCLWGTSSENLYFGNQGGKIVHWDGRRGRLENVQTVKLTDIWGFSSDDIYACGTDYRAELYHFDGASWSLVIIGDTPPNSGQIQDPFYSFWGADNNYKYLAGYYVYQNAIEDWGNKLDFGYNIEKIRGSSSNNIFTVGHLGGYHTSMELTGIPMKN
ncbi:MAG: hypothetical protein PHW27_14815, partial [Melioribacteraceae bacterium]|nr:hypothetical protein [Melioribacteraceae bacterium]